MQRCRDAEELQGLVGLKVEMGQTRRELGGWSLLEYSYPPASTDVQLSTCRLATYLPAPTYGGEVQQERLDSNLNNLELGVSKSRSLEVAKTQNTSNLATCYVTFSTQVLLLHSLLNAHCTWQFKHTMKDA
ncbi:hypothetical protein HYALB_00008926 [Hymenoscyphus albidus]|uniref:Uncharacterized protein n=1 Tax=Hymenoscyphus albidus TaxID=595503 RepID=A0A9N9LLC7_9HELO|nr:hypothetical protein HYALB_00008926 [Hymenoscyphus albidus]